MKTWLRTGLGSALLATSVVAGFVACSGEQGSPTPVSDSPDASTGALEYVQGRDIELSSRAVTKVRDLSSRFYVRPAVTSLPPIAPPRGPVDPLRKSPYLQASPRAVINPSNVERFVLDGGRFRAVIRDGLRAQYSQTATVHLPERASDPVRVQDDGSGLAVEFVQLGSSSDVKLEVADGLALYVGGGTGGTDVLHRVSPTGTEDFITFEAPPAKSEVSYEVDVRNVAGLRTVAGTIEFLSSDGYPRLRINEPWLVDATGQRHTAQLSLAGCAADTTTQVPWGRAVTAPGADSCTVTVKWDGTKIAYPAILDPAWTATGSMAAPRSLHGGTTLFNGDVLIIGGQDDGGQGLATAEIWKGATFTSAGSMAVARMYIGRVANLGTSVMALGGLQPNCCWLNTWSLYSVSGTSWSEGTTSTNYYYYDRLQPAVANGYVALFYPDNWNGSYYVTQPERWNSQAGGTVTNIPWTLGIQGPRSHFNGAVVPITTGKWQGYVMLAGGRQYDPGVGWYNSKTVDIYDPAADKWEAELTIPDMQNAHGEGAKGMELLDGKILIAGGQTGATDLYDPDGNTWTNTGTHGPTQPTWQQGSNLGTYNGADSLQAGKVIMAVTPGGPTASNVVQIFDPTATSNWWSQFSTSVFTRGTEGQLLELNDGRLMSAPADPDVPSGPASGVYIFDFKQLGDSCSDGRQCKSGYCASGVCCNSVCDGTCNTCIASEKSSGVDGTCGTKKDGISDAACAVDNGQVCGNYGTCNGTGGCKVHPAGEACVGTGSGTHCVSGSTGGTQQYVCSGSGGTCSTAGNCATGYTCREDQGGCVASCDANDWCASGYYCNELDQCKPKKDPGFACNGDNNVCKSGFCKDGFCCDKACNGLCEACSDTLTGQGNGKCAPVYGGQDPQNECASDAATTCKKTGFCNGMDSPNTACELYPDTTLCHAAACKDVSFEYPAVDCDGSGNCPGQVASPCPTGHRCIGTSCNTICGSDNDCLTGYFCSSGTCTTLKPKGFVGCDRDAMCATGICATADGDNVCCDARCDGECESCRNAKNGLNGDGTCHVASAGADPDSECPPGQGECDATGACNANGQCQAYQPSSKPCGDVLTCTDGTVTAYHCAGNSANCVGQQQANCTPFTCLDATQCRTACTTDTDCVAGTFCESGACSGVLADGQPCTDDVQCANKHCANIGVGTLSSDNGSGGAGGDSGLGAGGDGGANGGSDIRGVCCDTACSGTCEACKRSLRNDRGIDGTCENVPSGTDPLASCPEDLNNKCGDDGLCDATGNCRQRPAGTACGSTSCVGNSVQGQICNGGGTCINASGSTPCDPYLCSDVNGSEQCTNPCASDTDCQSGFYCDVATCVEKLALGKACSSNIVCASGFCVDGLCCDTSCRGQCEACNLPGDEGICSAVEGSPVGDRPACDGTAGDDCAGTCDGITADKCSYPVTECGSPSCENGKAKSSTCDGNGACQANEDEDCGAYSCAGSECRIDCELDEHCASGYACDSTTGNCTPAAVAASCSVDRAESVGRNGNTACRPYLCDIASGACAVFCATTTDCSAGFVCEPTTKACITAPPQSSIDEGGCGCRTAGGGTQRSSLGGLAGLAFVLAGMRRLRRRVRADRNNAIVRISE